MYKKLSFLTLLLLLLSNILVKADTPEKDQYNQRMQWFKDAKLGIFIHWGLYSKGIDSESWCMYHKKRSWEEYMTQQAKDFTAANYQPEEWAKLFKEVGADYAVMTSKHHDGFALWDTKYSKINAKDFSAAKRDVYTPWVKAIRNAGLKVGVYYSLCDWSHPDYSPITFDRPEKKLRKLYPQQRAERYLTPWQRFTKFNFNEMHELFERYQPDLVWFDGDWEHKADEWPSRVVKDSLLSWNPKVIVNSRLNWYGDYNTPEQDPPVIAPDRPWELCLTMNESWGYRADDHDYKSAKYLIETFIRSVAKGGNLLLDIGPKSDGTIPKPQVELLKEIGQWYQTNGTAIRNTEAGIPYGHFDGETTLSKDHKTINLFLMGGLKNFTTLRGVKGEIESIKVLGSNSPVKYKVIDSAPWNDIPGIIQIFFDGVKEDPYVTVVTVTFKTPISLYRGIGHAVEMND